MIRTGDGSVSAMTSQEESIGIRFGEISHTHTHASSTTAIWIWSSIHCSHTTSLLATRLPAQCFRALREREQVSQAARHSRKPPRVPLTQLGW
jgi:hypothetical protein